MKNAKRKYGIILLGAVALQVLLPVLILIATLVVRQAQWDIVADAKSTFEHLRISDNVSEIKAGEEIVYQGVLYDVKEIKKERNGYLVTALADKTETNLREMNVGLATNSSRSTEMKVLPFVFLYHEINTGWEPLTGLFAQADFNEYYHSPLPLRTMSITTPPPRHTFILS